jgi:cytochrome c oxidase assembly protein subunit 11
MHNHQKTLKILLIITLFMFGFTFALVPIYNVFCKVTGLNGKVDIQRPEAFRRYKDTDLTNSRLITVEFDVNRNRNLNCEFSPQHTAIQLKTGELTLTSYHVKNLTNKTIVIQAIPSITPGVAAKYLKKLECFCFNKQTLKPGEAMHLPLRFWLEPEIPDEVKRLTLSYTLFDVTDT